MMTRSIRPLILLLLHGTLIIHHAPPTYGGATNKIDPELRQKIGSAPAGSTWDIIIEFKEDSKLEVELDAVFSTNEERNVKVYKSMLIMEKYAEESQRNVQEAIKNFRKTHDVKNMKVESIYLNGNLDILKASEELIRELGDVKKPENANIIRIREDRGFKLEPPPEEKSSPVDLSGQGEEGTSEKKGLKEAWGLEQINAPAWWDKNYNGTGVIVGHMDSGVDVRHPSLKWNWLGKPYGWLDPVEDGVNNTFPYEHNPERSHGTHTLGIIVGRGGRKGIFNTVHESDVKFFGVGVAPGARWVSCLACRKGDGSCSEVLQDKCAKFLYCPDGKENKCLLRPNVVSMSFGCPQNSTWRCNADVDITMIARFVRAGVILVVAAGNNGEQGCTTLDSPADHRRIISVGNVDKDDVLYKTSGRGPPDHKYLREFQIDNSIFKPDIVAPGQMIISTVYTGRAAKFQFDYRSGTSMAAPHVAGAIALLLSRTEDLTFDQVKGILVNNTKPNVKVRSDGRKCGNFSDTDRPNHKFGYGRLKLPDPNDPNLPAEKRPTRYLPPPPDYSDLADNATPNPVLPGIVGVVMMATVAFLMTGLMGI